MARTRCCCRRRLRRPPDPRYHILAPLRQETLGNMGKLYRPISIAERNRRLQKAKASAGEDSSTQLQRTTQFEPTWPGSVFMDGRSELLLLLLARPVQWFPCPAEPSSGGEMKIAEQESNLLRLPQELLEMILGYTSHRDTFAVALTCMAAWQLVKHRLHRQLMQILGRWAGTPLIAAGECVTDESPPGLKGLSLDIPGLGPTGWQAQVLGRRYRYMHQYPYPNSSIGDGSDVPEMELLEDEKFVGLSERIEEVIALGMQGNSTTDSLHDATTITSVEASASACSSASTSNAPTPSQSNWSARTYLQPACPLTPEIEGLLYPFITSFYPSDREWVLRNNFHKLYVRGKFLRHGGAFGIYKTKGRLGKFDPVSFEEVMVWAGVVWADRVAGAWAGCGIDLVPWEEFERQLEDEEGGRVNESDAENERNEGKSGSECRANKGKGKEVGVKGGGEGKAEGEREREVQLWEDVSDAIVKLVKKRMKAPLDARGMTL